MKYNKNIEFVRDYYNKKRTSNNIAALDYCINGGPISEELYNIYFVDSTIKSMEFAPHHKVLEVGCGFGGILKKIETQVDYAVGIELSENLASRFDGKSKIIVTDILSTNFPSETFDRIYMVSVAIFFESIHYFKKVVNKLFTYLKPDGILLIGDQPLGKPNQNDNYLVIDRIELNIFLDQFNKPYSIQVQSRIKRKNTERYDILIYKDK